MLIKNHAYCNFKAGPWILIFTHKKNGAILYLKGLKVLLLMSERFYKNSFILPSLFLSLVGVATAMTREQPVCIMPCAQGILMLFRT